MELGDKPNRSQLSAARPLMSRETRQSAPTEPQLSWVVPMYRTGDFIERLCVRASDSAHRLGLSYELVFVDDACPDHSADRAEPLAARFPIRVCRLPTNQGQDAAIRAGLRVCRGKWAVILDGDLQDPPEALLQLWPHASDYDAVFADRFGAYESRTRLVSSFFYRRCLEVLGGLPPGSGLFVLMNRRLIEHVTAAHGSRAYVLADIAGARGRYISVPVLRSPRPSGKSSYGFVRRWTRGVMSLWQVFAATRLGRRF